MNSCDTTANWPHHAHALTPDYMPPFFHAHMVVCGSHAHCTSKYIFFCFPHVCTEKMTPEDLNEFNTMHDVLIADAVNYLMLRRGRWAASCFMIMLVIGIGLAGCKCFFWGIHIYTWTQDCASTTGAVHEIIKWEVEQVRESSYSGCGCGRYRSGKWRCVICVLSLCCKSKSKMYLQCIIYCV